MMKNIHYSSTSRVTAVHDTTHYTVSHAHDRGGARDAKGKTATTPTDKQIQYSRDDRACL